MSFTRLLFSPLLFALLLLTSTPGWSEQTADGLHTEAWFNRSSGDLSRDLESASAEGKILAIFWEQPGCHFCEQMHEVNLKIEETAHYIRENFYPVLLNMRGKGEITDFDGTSMSETKLARHHRVAGTPTIEFRNSEAKEISRLPGYAQPVIFHGVFEFVATGAYENADLVPWLKETYLKDRKTGS